MTEPSIMTRKSLDAAVKEVKSKCCDVDWQDHLLGITQNCHPGIGLAMQYNPRTGFMLLSCPACKTGIGIVQVADIVDPNLGIVQLSELVEEAIEDINAQLTNKIFFGGKGEEHEPPLPSRN